MRIQGKVDDQIGEKDRFEERCRQMETREVKKWKESRRVRCFDGEVTLTGVNLRESFV